MAPAETGPEGVKQRRTWEQKLGLKFPVTRTKRQMRKFLTHNQKYVHLSAAVYLAAVLDFLAGELLEAAGNTTRDANKARITPRFIFLAIKKDRELDVLLQDTMISEGGVEPFVHLQLLQPSYY